MVACHVLFITKRFRFRLFAHVSFVFLSRENSLYLSLIVSYHILMFFFQERQEYADVIKQLRAELAIEQQKVEEMQSWIAMQKAGQSQQLLVQMLELQNRVSFDVEDPRPNVWLDINLTRLCNSFFCKHLK